MPRFLMIPALIAILAAAPAPAFGQPAARQPSPARAEAPCAGTIAPPGFAGFGRATGATTYLGIGQSRRVALTPAAGLRFAAPPERAPGDGGVGAALPVRIDRAGTYRVALSAPMWIDMVAEGGVGSGRRIASGAHIMGPRCSGIRKIVDFALEPGLHRLQLSAPAPRAGGTSADVMIVRR